jgi:hypothetical protein
MHLVKEAIGQEMNLADFFHSDKDLPIRVMPFRCQLLGGGGLGSQECFPVDLIGEGDIRRKK